MSPTSPTKRIAVLGSSGGNLHSHGGDDPQKLLEDILKQLKSAGFQPVRLQYVAASGSLDKSHHELTADLWELAGETPLVTFHGTLEQVNEQARQRDHDLSRAIREEHIDGLVIVSADPNDTNAKALEAAAERKIATAGTGGTSIAQAQRLGVNLVGASGTTGTTSLTRAVAYTSALAKEWSLPYKPSLGSSPNNSHSPSDSSAWRRISIRGIMVGSIPAFIAMALILAITKIPVGPAAELTAVFELLQNGLPVIIAAVAARRISGLDEVGLVAGVIAGVLAVDGGIIGGLVSGILAGLLADALIRWTLGHKFPATTANLVTGAFAGLLPGLLVFYILAPVTSALGDLIREGLEAAITFNPVLAGVIAGLVIWPAIIGGVYHSVILPIVLLEIGEKGHSFLGAVDMVGLVIVSLGITLANVVKPKSSGERALAGTGAGINFGFGTFVEASYPFMFGDKKVFATAILSAGIGGGIVGYLGLESTAYVPTVMAPFLSTNPLGMLLAMVVSGTLAFTLTLLANVKAVGSIARVG